MSDTIEDNAVKDFLRRDVPKANVRPTQGGQAPDEAPPVAVKHRHCPKVDRGDGHPVHRCRC